MDKERNCQNFDSCGSHATYEFLEWNFDSCFLSIVKLLIYRNLRIKKTVNWNLKTMGEFQIILLLKAIIKNINHKTSITKHAP